ncbi:MAG: hypothetical protein QM308_07595 [Bacillota bacterium]|nr:hypothetical protein [Bacillota bacterium]
MFNYVYSQGSEGVEYDYVSIHQSILLFRMHNDFFGKIKSGPDNYKFGEDYQSGIIYNAIIKEISKREKNNDLLVWDSRLCLDFDGRVNQKVSYDAIPLGNYKSLLFLHVKEKHKNELIELRKGLNKLCKKSSAEYILKEIGPNITFIYDKESESKVFEKYPWIAFEFENEKIFNKIDDDNSLWVHRALFSAESTNISDYYENSSSNVYANRYFNAKIAFLNPNLLSRIAYLMSYQLYEKCRDEVEKADALICSSLNGMCLCVAVGNFLNKNVVYLKNVGPNMTFQDHQIIERIIKAKNYIYIFDFSCMGMEYSRTKMLCNMKSAKILAGMGISYYKMPSDNNSHLHALYQINKYDSDYYKCITEKNDSSNA